MVYNFTGSAEAHAKVALHRRGRKPAAFDSPNGHIIEQFVKLAQVLASALAVFVAFAVRHVERFYLRIEYVLVGAGIGKLFGFFLAEEGAMNAHRFGIVHGLVKHITTAQ